MCVYFSHRIHSISIYKLKKCLSVRLLFAYLSILISYFRLIKLFSQVN